MTEVAVKQAQRTFLCDALLLREGARVLHDVWPWPVGWFASLTLRATARLLEVRGGVA